MERSVLVGRGLRSQLTKDSVLKEKLLIIHNLNGASICSPLVWATNGSCRGPEERKATISWPSWLSQRWPKQCFKKGTLLASQPFAIRNRIAEMAICDEKEDQLLVILFPGVKLSFFYGYIRIYGIHQRQQFIHSYGDAFGVGTVKHQLSQLARPVICDGKHD